jgi:hypothetical protein
MTSANGNEMDGELLPELVIDVDPPVILKNGTYNELRLREPKAGEVRQAEFHLRASVNVESMRRYQIALIARVSGWPEPAVEGVPISKLNEASAFLQGFIEGGRPTGAS